MADPLSISCPKCRAVLKLKDRSKVGKKVACPKCQAPFVIKAPPEPEEDEFDYGLPDESEAYEEEEPAPPPRRKAGASKSKGGSKRPPAKSSGPNPIVLIVAGVVALVLLAGVGVGAYWMLGSSSPEVDQIVATSDQPVPVETSPTSVTPSPANQAPTAAPVGSKLDLTYLPEDVELIVRVKVADIWGAPVLQGLLTNPLLQGALDTMQEKAQMLPSDIESITVGTSKLAAMMPVISAGVPPKSEQPVAIVVRTSKPFNIPELKIEETGATKITINGQECYQFPSEDQPGGLYFPEPNVAVATNLSRLQATVGKPQAAQARTDLNFVDPDQHLMIVVVPQDKAKLLESAPPPEAGMPGAELADALRNDLQAASIGISFKTGIGFEVAVNATDAASATRIKGEIDKLIAEGKSEFATQRAEIPPDYQAFADAVVNGVNATANGSVVRVSTALPDSVQKSIAALPATIMSLAMGGGGLGMGGGPDAFAGDGGESQGASVTSTAAEGLPEGMTMQASAGWGDYGSYEEGQQRPAPLKVVMTLEGATAERVAAVGFVSLSDLETEGGLPLKRVRPTGSETLTGPHDKFVAIERSEYDGHPVGKVLVPLAFERPEKQVSKLTKIAGAFQLKIAGKTEDVLLANAAQAIGKPTTNATLKDVGFDVKQVGDEMKYLVVKVGSQARIAALEVLDGQGAPLESANVSFSDYDGPQHTVFFENGVIPGQFGFKINLQSDLELASVPFEFENLQVPAPPPLEADSPPFKWTAPANLTEIPEGIHVEARARWSDMRPVDENGNEGPAPLDIVVDLSGKLPRKAVAFGFLSYEKATATGGKALTPFQPEFVFIDPTKQLIKLNSDDFFETHPVEGVRATFRFNNPGNVINQVSEFEGSLKLMTVDEQRLIAFDKVQSRVGKTLSHPDLKELGLDIKVGKEPPQLLLALSKGNPVNIEKVTAIDAFGGPVPGVSMSVSSGVAYLYFSGDEGIPKDVGLEFKLNFGLEEVTVPLKFQNIEVLPIPKDE